MKNNWIKWVVYFFFFSIRAAHLQTEYECKLGRENRAENPEIELSRTKHRAENVTIIRLERNSEWLLDCQAKVLVNTFVSYMLVFLRNSF